MTFCLLHSFVSQHLFLFYFLDFGNPPKLFNLAQNADKVLDPEHEAAIRPRVQHRVSHALVRRVGKVNDPEVDNVAAAAVSVATGGGAVVGDEQRARIEPGTVIT